MDPKTSTSTGSSIEITRKTTRKTSSLLLQSGVRLFRGQVTKVKTVAGPGSPELSPPSKIYETCNIHERNVCDIRIYDINLRSKSTRQFVNFQENQRSQINKEPSLAGPGELYGVDRGKILQKVTSRSSEERPQTPKEPLARIKTENLEDGAPLMPALSPVITRDFAHTPASPKPAMKHRRHIYYFAGGSWQSPPIAEHWKFAAHLTKTLTQRGMPTTVSMVSYPLAPHCPASISLAMLERMYYELLPSKTSTEKNHISNTPIDPSAFDDPEIILAGDSSGGNIVLGLTLHILSKDPKASAPDSIMVLSPTVDMRTSNPDIPKIEKKDPILSKDAIVESHAAWLGSNSDISETDPRVSPICGDLSVFKTRGVSINGTNGGYDVLGADVRLFLKKLAEAGVQGKWLEWDKQMHVWPLTFSYGLPEGKEAVKWMVEVMDPNGKDPKPKMAYEE